MGHRWFVYFMSGIYGICLQNRSLPRTYINTVNLRLLPNHRFDRHKVFHFVQTDTITKITQFYCEQMRISREERKQRNKKDVKLKRVDRKKSVFCLMKSPKAIRMFWFIRCCVVAGHLVVNNVFPPFQIRIELFYGHRTGII